MDEKYYISKESEKTQTRHISNKKKIDVTKLLSIIPPASELKRKETKLKEKRIRVRYDESLPPNTIKLSKQLAQLLGINKNDLVEIVVAGRHKFAYNALIVDENGINEVYCNPEELKERGVADNSIATIRKYMSRR